MRLSLVLSHVSALASSGQSFVTFIRLCLANIVNFTRLCPGRPNQISRVLNWTPSPSNNFFQRLKFFF